MRHDAIHLLIVVPQAIKQPSNQAIKQSSNHLLIVVSQDGDLGTHALGQHLPNQDRRALGAPERHRSGGARVLGARAGRTGGDGARAASLAWAATVLAVGGSGLVWGGNCAWAS
eukprot:1271188-Prymnesium_polylepis.1